MKKTTPEKLNEVRCHEQFSAIDMKKQEQILFCNN